MLTIVLTRAAYVLALGSVAATLMAGRTRQPALVAVSLALAWMAMHVAQAADRRPRTPAHGLVEAASLCRNASAAGPVSPAADAPCTGGRR